MQQLPIYIQGFAILINLAAVVFFYFVTERSQTATFILLCWLGLQAGLSLGGFYTVTDTIPPRLLFLILPPLLTILAFFATSRGRAWLDGCNSTLMYLVHIIRIPVEIMLYLLFLNKLVPGIITFEDGNYDIFSGITAPVVYYFARQPGKMPERLLLCWNLVCLGLLFNVVYHAIFAVPTAFQKYGFEQPNVAILYFPFSWVPGFLVPLVFFCHLVCIRQSLRRISMEVQKI